MFGIPLGNGVIFKHVCTDSDFSGDVHLYQAVGFTALPLLRATWHAPEINLYSVLFRMTSHCKVI